MKIAIDISPLDSPHGARGMGVYTKNVIESLQQYDTVNSYIFFTRKQNIPDTADIVHYPYFDPFFLTLPLKKKKPVIVTVHDLIPLLFPDKFPSGIRGYIKWQLQKASVMKAERILTVSECSKNDIHKITGYKKDNIDVIYSAPSPVFRNDIDEVKMKETKKKYLLPEEYILYVGDVNWNKNIPSLLIAFAQLSKDYPTLHLVLAGKSFKDKTIPESIEIDHLIRKYHIEHVVNTPGYMPDEDLCRTYQNAICVVQPSYYEGFGFPVLEAMASGCPVVVADNSGLHEILGPSVTIDAHTIDSIIQGIRTVIGFSKQKRNDIIKRGIQWAARFTWEKTAKNIIQSYEHALR